MSLTIIEKLKLLEYHEAVCCTITSNGCLNEWQKESLGIVNKLRSEIYSVKI